MEEQKELTAIEKEYPEILDNLKEQKNGSNADLIIISFMKDLINEIKQGKRNDLDIGDSWQIGLFAKKYGLKISEKLDDLLIALSDYKVMVQEEIPLENIEDVEKKINQLGENQ